MRRSPPNAAIIPEPCKSTRNWLIWRLSAANDKLLADCGGEPAPATGKGPPALAGKSTLNRIEHAWDTGNRRYHQISANLKKLSNLFVTLFLEAHQTPPSRITLDIDATDVETHGRQENAFFHGYYEHRCFLPLYVFCGRHILLAQLRPANIDGARGARNQIRRIVQMIRERWPNVDILLRGDSGFARENLMRWCEGNAVDYVFGGAEAGPRRARPPLQSLAGARGCFERPPVASSSRRNRDRCAWWQ